jgi:hypothetical protein
MRNYIKVNARNTVSSIGLHSKTFDHQNQRAQAPAVVMALEELEKLTF